MRRIIPNRIYIKHQFKKILGYSLNLKTPVTFNEKMQYLKLHDHRKKYVDLVDKYKVKNIVSKAIGKQYIIPTIGIWKNAKDINYDVLPKSFVLKCTHDSGSVILCKNKSRLNKTETTKLLNNKLSNNYYYNYREWPYKKVKPMIIAEPYLGNNLNDYKVQMINGAVDNIMICDGRYSERGVRYYYFDKEWNYLPYCQYDDIDAKTFTYPKPSKMNEVLQLSEKLGKKFKQIRIDWYIIGDKIYFGEFTFFTNGGYDNTITYDADLELGKKLSLNEVKNEN